VNSKSRYRLFAPTANKNLCYETVREFITCTLFTHLHLFKLSNFFTIRAAISDMSPRGAETKRGYFGATNQLMSAGWAVCLRMPVHRTVLYYTLWPACRSETIRPASYVPQDSDAQYDRTHPFFHTVSVGTPDTSKSAVRVWSTIQGHLGIIKLVCEIVKRKYVPSFPSFNLK
jgi:hypothetical protein